MLLDCAINDTLVKPDVAEDTRGVESALVALETTAELEINDEVVAMDELEVLISTTAVLDDEMAEAEVKAV